MSPMWKTEFTLLEFTSLAIALITERAPGCLRNKTRAGQYKVPKPDNTSQILLAYPNMHLKSKCLYIWSNSLPECSVLLKHQEESCPYHQMQWIWAHLILQRVELKIWFLHSNQRSHWTISRRKINLFNDLNLNYWNHIQIRLLMYLKMTK